MADYHRMGSNNSNILCFLLFQPSLVATFLTKKSTVLRLSKILNLMKGPKETIQELIYNFRGIHVQSCKGEKDDPCPENGMRQRHVRASFSSCPWVMTIHGHLDFNAIDDILKNVIDPPDTQYSLASVIINGQHFEGIILDGKNSQGIHLIYDGRNEPEKGFKLSRQMMQYLHMHIIIKLQNCGMSRLTIHLLHQDLHLYPP